MEFTTKQNILVDTLKLIGLEPTVNRLSFLVAWNMAEGGKAINNPINTTLNLKTDKGQTVFNKAGVKNYSTPTFGAQATAKTLRLPYYKAIFDNLKADKDPRVWVNNPDVKAALKTWGTTNNVIATKLKQNSFMVAVQSGLDLLTEKAKKVNPVIPIVAILFLIGIFVFTFNQNNT